MVKYIVGAIYPQLARMITFHTNEPDIMEPGCRISNQLKDENRAYGYG